MTSTEFFLISKSVITASTLFFFFSMALAFFYLGYSTQQKNYYYGMYTGMALVRAGRSGRPLGYPAGRGYGRGNGVASYSQRGDMERR